MRRALLLVAFAISAGAVGWAVILAVHTGPEAPPWPRDAWSLVPPVLGRLQAAPRRSGRSELLFLGDSTAVMYPPESQIPRRLQQALRRRGARTQVHSLAYGGMHPFDYYTLADVIVAAGPDQLVMALNLYSLSNQWRETVSRPEMAAWIAPRRWVQAARQPLHWAGVTFDQLILHSSLLHGGALDLWLGARQEFRRIYDAYEVLGQTLEIGTGDPQRPRSARDLWLALGAGHLGRHQDAPGVLLRYSEALDGVARGHPVLSLLGAAVADYRSAGIEVLVYVVPANVEYFAKIGVQNDAGLGRTLEHLREVVEGSGGRLLDLHALLGDRFFRDPAGHFTHHPLADGPTSVAERIAEALTATAGPQG